MTNSTQGCSDTVVRPTDQSIHLVRSSHYAYSCMRWVSESREEREVSLGFTRCRCEWRWSASRRCSNWRRQRRVSRVLADMARSNGGAALHSGTGGRASDETSRWTSSRRWSWRQTWERAAARPAAWRAAERSAARQNDEHWRSPSTPRTAPVNGQNVSTFNFQLLLPRDAL